MAAPTRVGEQFSALTAGANHHRAFVGDLGGAHPVRKAYRRDPRAASQTANTVTLCCTFPVRRKERRAAEAAAAAGGAT
jgi:hypothetical protein